MNYKTKQLREELKEFLKDWLKKDGNNLSKFAQLSGMGQQQMTAFLDGTRDSRESTMNKLEKTLRIEQLK